jgi:hypothetical protein
MDRIATGQAPPARNSTQFATSVEASSFRPLGQGARAQPRSVDGLAKVPAERLDGLVAPPAIATSVVARTTRARRGHKEMHRAGDAFVRLPD